MAASKPLVLSSLCHSCERNVAWINLRDGAIMPSIMKSITSNSAPCSAILCAAKLDCFCPSDDYGRSSWLNTIDTCRHKGYSQIARLTECIYALLYLCVLHLSVHQFFVDEMTNCDRMLFCLDPRHLN